MRLPGAVALIAFWPATASANPIIHPASFILPIAWFLLIPVILIEARFAQRVLGWDFRWSVSVSCIANFISTLIGIPVALVSPLPILGYYDQFWFFQVLIIPLYLASILTEGFIMSLFRELYASRRPSYRWALIANGATYLMIVAILAFWLLVMSWNAPPHLQPEPPY